MIYTPRKVLICCRMFLARRPPFYTARLGQTETAYFPGLWASSAIYWRIIEQCIKEHRSAQSPC